MNATLNLTTDFEQEQTEKTETEKSCSVLSPLPPLPSVTPARQTLQYFPAQEIAQALGVSKKTIHRRADALRWPKEQVGSGFHYCVSPELAARIAAARPAPVCLAGKAGEIHGSAERRPTVRFEDIAGDARAARKVGLRQKAVEDYLALRSNLGQGTGAGNGRRDGCETKSRSFLFRRAVCESGTRRLWSMASTGWSSKSGGL